MQKEEQAFSDFLDSLKGDGVFEGLQDIMRAVFLEGYRSGERNAAARVFYITYKKKDKNRTEE